MLWVHRSKKDQSNDSDHPFEKFSGMIKSSPVAAAIMGMFMLSLAGVPPFSLFWGKMYLIGAAVNGGYVVLALIMALNSAIAAYYYLKLIVYMFLYEPRDDDRIAYLGNANNTLRTVVGISALVTIASIFMIEPIIRVVSYYVQISGF
jgi:NADH-quinone oxidoreductase subunit N